MLGSFQILDDGEPRRRPDGGSLYWRGVFPRAEAEIVAGQLGRGRAARHRQLRLDGRRTCFCRSGGRCPHVGVPLDNQWDALAGRHLCLAEPVPGSGRTTAR